MKSRGIAIMLIAIILALVLIILNYILEIRGMHNLILYILSNIAFNALYDMLKSTSEDENVWWIAGVIMIITVIGIVIAVIQIVKDASNEDSMNGNKVTDVQAEYKDGEVVISWDDCNAVQYKVTRQEETGEYITLSHEVTTDEYIDKNVADGCIYNYKIVPYFYDENNELMSKEDYASDAVSVLTLENVETIEPVKVTGVQAVYANGEIRITWDDCNAVRYRISRKTGSGTYIELERYWMGDEYIDTDLIENQIYYYKIAAYFNAELKEEEASDEAWVVATDNIVITEPEQVTGVKAEYEDNKIKITWEDCSVVGYKVSRRIGNDSYKTLKYDHPINEYIDEDLIEGKTYYYKIAAYFYDENGQLIQGAESEWVQVTIAEKVE